MNNKTNNKEDEQEQHMVKTCIKIECRSTEKYTKMGVHLKNKTFFHKDATFS